MSLILMMIMFFGGMYFYVEKAIDILFWLDTRGSTPTWLSKLINKPSKTK